MPSVCQVTHVYIFQQTIYVDHAAPDSDTKLVFSFNVIKPMSTYKQKKIDFIIHNNKFRGKTTLAAICLIFPI